MIKLEISFSEEDVTAALQAYINRFFLPHRQVTVTMVKANPSNARLLTAVVVPAPPETFHFGELTVTQKGRE